MRYLTGGVQRVLLATDFTEASQRGFDAAVRFARMFGAELHLLHVHEERLFLRGSPSRDVDALLADLDRKRAAWLERFRATAADAGVPTKVTAREGIASATILSFAEEIDAGTIVLGTTGARGLKRLLPGSTAKKVLRHAERPLLTISPLASVASCTAGGSFAHVLYPADLEGPDPGLAAACVLAERSGAKLTVVHVQRMPTIASMPGEPIITLPRTVSRETQQRLDALLHELRASLPGVEVAARLELHPDVPEAIAEVAERIGCDLIAAPRHGSTTIGKHVFGRTAERLAKIAPAPVLLFTPNSG